MRLVLIALVAVVLAVGAARAGGVECEAMAVTTVRNYLDSRDAREFRRAQRYFSPDFGAHFTQAFGVAYLDYFGDPDVTWRQSAILESSTSQGQCTVSASSIRDTGGIATATLETYILVGTYLGWRIDDWRWQPAP